MYLSQKIKSRCRGRIGGEGETLARHEKTLLALAKKLKLPITKIYKEILSGETIAGRPVMQQLLQDVEAGIWQGVLVMEVERLGRGNTLDQGIILNAFKYSSTKIITPMKSYDPNDEFDEEYFEFSQFMSRREYKTILRRMQRGREASVKEGKFAGSIAPFGYRRVKLPQEKGFTLEVEGAEAAAVKLAYELYAYGDPQPDGTFADIGRATIAKRLDQMGIRNRKGGTWATASVTRMLQNPVYIGKVHWNRRPEKKHTENGKIKKTRPLAENYLLVDGLHEPIISEELWNLAQAKMKQHYRPTGVNGIMQNPLAGLVHCSYCGNAMQRRPYLKTGQPASLICTTHFCPQISSPLYMVEGKILEALSLWMKQHEPTWEEESSINVFSTKIMALEHTIADMEQELQGLQFQFEKIFEFLETGIYTPEVFTARNKTLSEKMAEIRSAIEETQAELSNLKAARKNQVSMIPKIKNILDTYETLTPAEKNKLLKEVLDHVEYHKKIKGKKNVSADNFEIILFPKISPEN